MAHLYPNGTLILGHRGASAYAPENTLAAFGLALEQGADGFELDVTLSADGVPVVIHDDTVDRTTNGHGRVNALTLEALQTLDAGYARRFEGRYVGERLPTLAQVFEAFGPRAIINVELKHDHTPGRRLAERVVELIHAHGLQQRVILSSFQLSSLRRVRRLDPNLPLAVLYVAAGVAARLVHWLAPVLPVEAHHPEHTGVDEKLVAWYHAHGYRVNVWTPNEPADLRRLLAAGVDGLITDVPDRAVTLRAQVSAPKAQDG